MPTSLLIAASIATTAVGVGMQVSAAGDAADAQMGIAHQEMKADKQRELQMELDARRRQREVIRNQQRGRSVALSNATAQNAQGGSGLPGGYGQIGGMAGTELLGIRQNLEIGRNLFDINAQINMYKMAAAAAGAQAAFGSGLQSMGSTMMGAASAFGRIYGGSSGGASGYGTNGGIGYGQQMQGFQRQGFGVGGLY